VSNPTQFPADVTLHVTFSTTVKVESVPDLTTAAVHRALHASKKDILCG
jgi:hypothetical protein